MNKNHHSSPVSHNQRSCVENVKGVLRKQEAQATLVLPLTFLEQRLSSLTDVNGKVDLDCQIKS
jgi:hypothetical protein